MRPSSSWNGTSEQLLVDEVLARQLDRTPLVIQVEAARALHEVDERHDGRMIVLGDQPIRVRALLVARELPIREERAGDREQDREHDVSRPAADPR
jgi:hypothetical protein